MPLLRCFSCHRRAPRLLPQHLSIYRTHLLPCPFPARLQRSGWEARWGDEEADRVAGATATAVAVAGAAAGFATAGGLDKATDDATDAGRVAGSRSDDPLADDFLPNDVESLKSMVRAVDLVFERQRLSCSGQLFASGRGCSPMTVVALLAVGGLLPPYILCVYIMCRRRYAPFCRV